MKCNSCDETAKTYYHADFYDVGEGAWVTDCGTGGCGFEAARTRKESRDNFLARRALKWSRISGSNENREHDK